MSRLNKHVFHTIHTELAFHTIQRKKYDLGCLGHTRWSDKEWELMSQTDSLRNGGAML